MKNFLILTAILFLSGCFLGVTIQKQPQVIVGIGFGLGGGTK